MYCNCSNKKKVKVQINFESIDVCSKRLGGCGKEIKSFGIDFSSSTKKGKIKLKEGMIGKKFKTRSGQIAKMIDYDEESDYPFIFIIDNGMGYTTTTKEDGTYSMYGEHNYDITEEL